MGLQKINWSQIDTTNVPDNTVVDIGSQNDSINSVYTENLYITGTSIGDLLINNGTFSGGTITLSSNSGTTIVISGISTNDIYVTGATFENNRLTLHKNDLSSVYVDIDNFSGLTVNGVITANTFYGESILGNPEEGSYSDGLFTDISNETYVGVFADRVNEILKSLAPSPAPPLSVINSTSTGVSGKMSYNASALPSDYFNIDGIGNLTSINFDGTYTVSGNRYGIFNNTLTTISGTLASGVAAGSGSPTPAYPANSFGDADQGTLELYCNDNTTPIHTVNLSSFNNGLNTNINGSGFNLSVATSVKFPMGANLDLFKYRTGTWTVAGSNIRNGWNYVRIIHRIGTNVRQTQYIDFFRDSVTTATSFSNESLSNLILSGNKNLSGVKYFTGGNAAYNVTVNNAYRNSYSSSSNAIVYSNNSTNLVVPSSESLPSSDNDVNKSLIINKTVNIVNNNVRILNETITLRTTVLRTVQGSMTSLGSSITSLLVDNVNTSSTTSLENFDDELYRLPSNLNFDNQSLLVTSVWNSANSIANTGTTGYNDGLLVYNGLLYYPNNAVVPNFSTLTYSPIGNVNYTGSNVTGERTYYRYFVKSGVGFFNLNVQGSSSIINSETNFTSTNQIKIDIKLPNGLNEGTGWMDVSKPFESNKWEDGDGCLQSGIFIFNTNNIIELGIKNTANVGVGGKIIIRIRVPQNWTGSLNSITIT